MQRSNWGFAFASVIGNGHLQQGKPCQDFCDVNVHDDFTIAVVSDGAGSSKHSEIGSENAVRFCLYQFKLAITSKILHREKFISQDEWHEIAKETLFAVRKDMENLCLDRSLDLKDLACTVIVMVLLPDGLLTTHIGDGRAGYCDSNMEWHPSITPFHGELANETVFITSDIWSAGNIDSYIESHAITGNISAFCLLTDGCEKASFECNLFNEETGRFSDPNRPFALFFQPNVNALIKLYHQGKDLPEINALWRSFLTEGNTVLKNELDDKTLILAVNLPDVPLSDFNNAKES